MEKINCFKKQVFFILLISSSLYSASIKQIWQWYNQKQYSKVCSKNIAMHEYYTYNDDEDFINMYAYSCLEIDMVNRLAIPITQLRKTKQSRANASYYATILYQKKLLYHSLIDKEDILPKNLPTTNYILSKIYDMYVKNKYIKNGNYLIFSNIDETSYQYRLFIKDDIDGFKKIVLQTLEKGIVIKTRMYW